MSPALSLLLLLGSLALFCVGVGVWARGSAAKAEAVARSRRERGEPASRRLRAELERRIRRTRAGSRLEDRLEVAGIGYGVADALLLTVAAAVFVFWLTGLVLPTAFAAALAAGVLWAAHAYVDYRRGKRTEEFVEQLPDLARVLSNASSAGLAMTSAVRLASRELDEPASGVLRRLVDELGLGQSVDGAMANLRERMPSREVGVLVSTLVIQQRAGGDTVRALRDMSETLEQRKDLRREVKTLLAGVIATSWAVAALAVASLVLLNAISPGLLERMSTRLIGQAALVVGFGLMGLGFWLIRRLTRIEI